MARTTRIHINQHHIKANRKGGERLPVITVKDYKQNRTGFEANILDSNGNVAARVVYSPDKPLSCGATVWVETQNEVEVF